MKNSVKRFMSIMLVLIMLFSVSTVGAGFSIKAKANDEMYDDDYLPGDVYPPEEDLYFFVIKNDEAVIYECDYNVQGYLKVPSTLGSYPVTTIGMNSFLECPGLTGVELPNTVKTIEQYGFTNCLNLESIKIPDSVTHIEDEGIFYCGIKSIKVPDSVTYLGGGAFAYCTKLETAKLGKGITEIYSTTFFECSSLYDVTIPDTITSIGSEAFEGCVSLQKLTIPASVTSFGEFVFGNSGLTDIYYGGTPEQWSNIEIGPDNDVLLNARVHFCDGDFTYYIKDGKAIISKCNNSSSETITIPDKINGCVVTEIEWDAFNDCRQLRNIEIPGGVTKINSSAFYRCSKLSNVYYHGTQAQWDKIKVSKYNDPLLNATLHFVCAHTSTELRGEIKETCTAEGYTGDLYCLDCGELISEGSVVPMSDVHSYQNGFCINCLHKDEEYIVPALALDTLYNVDKDGKFYLSFTPENSGTYSFSGVGEGTDGILYDENMNLICENNDSSDNLNFKITTGLSADKTYYLACNSTAAEFVPFDVKVESTDVISPVLGSDTVIDFDNKMIYGFAPGTNSIDEFVSSTGKYTFSKANENDTFGTGTKLVVKNENGQVIDSFDAVIFGDTNGDSWYDGMDALTVSCIANGMLTKEQVGEAVWLAADCNHDGTVDEFDVQLLEQAGLLLNEVDQTLTAQELETNSAYIEYFELIIQNPDTQKIEEPATSEQTPEQENKSVFSKVIESIINILNWILKLFK